MNLPILLAESLPAVTWPQAFLGAVTAICVCAFWGFLITERWPWDRR